MTQRDAPGFSKNVNPPMASAAGEHSGLPQPRHQLVDVIEDKRRDIDVNRYQSSLASFTASAEGGLSSRSRPANAYFSHIDGASAYGSGARLYAFVSEHSDMRGPLDESAVFRVAAC
jgi:hypothetical protein